MMFALDQYQLLDFGAGRKLERFGPYVLDRPAPAAVGHAPRQAALWNTAQARYERSGAEPGRWSCAAPLDDSWYVHAGELALELKLTEAGHLGLFPEQADNWRWLAEEVRSSDEPLNVLHLFAYTGASTLAASAAGARMTHVDAARNIVDWARRNAQASGLIDASVRWIAEDALKFARRELKRDNRYHAVILDPPAYGHGPRGEVWKLEQHLAELLSLCLELTATRRRFLLLTCHSGAWAEPSELLKFVVSECPQLRDEGTLSSGEMALVTAGGERLHAGAAIRWSAERKPRHGASKKPSSTRSRRP